MPLVVREGVAVGERVLVPVLEGEADPGTEGEEEGVRVPEREDDLVRVTDPVEDRVPEGVREAVNEGVAVPLGVRVSVAEGDGEGRATYSA